MNVLRYALEAALEREMIRKTGHCGGCVGYANAILADPAFRAALTGAVAEALGDVMPDQSARVGGPYAGLDSTLVTLTIDRFGFAAAIAARMLAIDTDGAEMVGAVTANTAYEEGPHEWDV